MRNRLSGVGLSIHYRRVAGVEGDVNEASCRGLKPGVGRLAGLVRMLDRASQSSASIVHSMEDDIDISDSFLRLVEDDLLVVLLFVACFLRMPMFPLANV